MLFMRLRTFPSSLSLLIIFILNGLLNIIKCFSASLAFLFYFVRYDGIYG